MRKGMSRSNMLVMSSISHFPTSFLPKSLQEIHLCPRTPGPLILSTLCSSPFPSMSAPSYVPLLALQNPLACQNSSFPSFPSSLNIPVIKMAASTI